MADTHTVFNKLISGGPKNVLGKYNLAGDRHSKNAVLTLCPSCNKKFKTWTNPKGHNVHYCENKKCKLYVDINKKFSSFKETKAGKDNTYWSPK
jgi:hypothetical protein